MSSARGELQHASHVDPLLEIPADFLTETGQDPQTNGGLWSVSCKLTYDGEPIVTSGEDLSKKKAKAAAAEAAWQLYVAKRDERLQKDGGVAAVAADPKRKNKRRREREVRPHLNIYILVLPSSEKSELQQACPIVAEEKYVPLRGTLEFHTFQTGQEPELESSSSISDVERRKAKYERCEQARVEGRPIVHYTSQSGLDAHACQLYAYLGKQQTKIWKFKKEVVLVCDDARTAALATELLHGCNPPVKVVSALKDVRPAMDTLLANYQPAESAPKAAKTS